jgi:hypothetical protein
MEALTRLVTESLARHGFDRPIDPRRLQWSRWFRCDSPHSLLVVPSKPGVFALAEEIAELGVSNAHVGTAPQACPERTERVERGCQVERSSTAVAADGVRRMLAVFQFSEDDDMAFTLDRTFTRPNPLRERLANGNCFLRFVVIQDQGQRRSICAALNQWLLSSAEKASGFPADFAMSLELPDRSGAWVPSPAQAGVGTTDQKTCFSGAATNIHCPQPLPSGF